MKDIIALWRNMSAKLTTFIQCIDRFLGTVAVDITTVKLILPYPALRASRQICGKRWDGNSDNRSAFDGLCQSLGLEQRETVSVLSLLLLKQPPMITPFHKPHSRQSWYFKQISS